MRFRRGRKRRDIKEREAKRNCDVRRGHSYKSLGITYPLTIGMEGDTMNGVGEGLSCRGEEGFSSSAAICGKQSEEHGFERHRIGNSFSMKGLDSDPIIRVRNNTVRQIRGNTMGKSWLKGFFHHISDTRQVSMKSTDCEVEKFWKDIGSKSRKGDPGKETFSSPRVYDRSKYLNAAVALF